MDNLTATWSRAFPGRSTFCWTCMTNLGESEQGRFIHPLPKRSVGVVWALAAAVAIAIIGTEARGAATTQATYGPLVVKTWQRSDGLPQSSVNALARTPDGYLWVATSG